MRLGKHDCVHSECATKKCKVSWPRVTRKRLNSKNFQLHQLNIMRASHSASTERFKRTGRARTECSPLLLSANMNFACRFLRLCMHT